MNTSTLIRYSLNIGAALLLVACGGSQPPTEAPGAMQEWAAGNRAVSGPSRTRRPTTSGDLIYITPDGLKKAFYIYTYPGGEWVTTVKSSYYPTGACSDETGNVFITANISEPSGKIYEYAHGATTPTRTLADPGPPEACAVDPTTGNLAVTNEGFQSRTGDVAIYAQARGTPMIYTDPENQYPSACGYDNLGNLFVDGANTQDEPVFAELPAGNQQFTNITLNGEFADGGSVQWDGQYITVAGIGRGVILRLQVSGSTGTVVGTTILKGNGRRYGPSKYWIQGATVIKTGAITGVWNYPKGGKPLEYLIPNGTHAGLHFYSPTVSVGSRLTKRGRQ